ncbi:hypothetical protein ACLESO_41355 [Pyxidicoccus sp. 3LG]
MAIPQQFQSPRLRTIDVQLVAGRGKVWLEKKVFELDGPGWTVRLVPFPLTDDEFDVVPHSEVEPAQAWELARRLRALDGVRDAEPTFEALYAEPRQQPVAGIDPDITPSELAFESLGGPGSAGNAFDWSAKLVQAEEAWALPGGVASRGRGIRIAHPDSGYKPHPELAPASTRRSAGTSSRAMAPPRTTAATTASAPRASSRAPTTAPRAQSQASRRTPRSSPCA